MNGYEKYKIIYADPPWKYNKDSGQGKATNHYNTESNHNLSKLPIGALAHPNGCALICWVVFPKISECIKVIEKWGFKIKTVYVVWIKTLKTKNLQQTTFIPANPNLFYGIGNYTRSNPEITLLCARGNISQYVINNNQLNVIFSPIEKHSKKPSHVRNMITTTFGDLPRIELFARQKTKGWDAWGNEIKSNIILT